MFFRFKKLKSSIYGFKTIYYFCNVISTVMLILNENDIKVHCETGNNNKLQETIYIYIYIYIYI